jgi:hypothetical protein
MKLAGHVAETGKTIPYNTDIKIQRRVTPGRHRLNKWNITRTTSAQKLKRACTEIKSRRDEHINILDSFMYFKESVYSTPEFFIAYITRSKLQRRRYKHKIICYLANCENLDSSGPGWGPVAGSCEHGNQPSGSIKRRGIS